MLTTTFSGFNDLSGPNRVTAYRCFEAPGGAAVTPDHAVCMVQQPSTIRCLSCPPARCCRDARTVRSWAFV